MSTTLASLTAALATRCGATVAGVGLDGAAVYPEAIATAVRDSGYCPADPFAVTDADLAATRAGDASKLVDVAELRVLQTCLNALVNPDLRVSLGEQKWGSFRGEVEKSVARLAERIEQRYAIGLGTLTMGTVSLPINEPLGPAGGDWAWG